MPAGQLRELITFQKRADYSADSPPGDEYGNVEGDFEDRFTVYARVRPLKGGETVIASRLEGQQPVVITVRYSPNTVQIANDWRAVNAVSGVVYAMQSLPANMDEKKKYLDILATIGRVP